MRAARRVLRRHEPRGASPPRARGAALTARAAWSPKPRHANCSEAVQATEAL
jgi:hypothetical protein